MHDRLCFRQGNLKTMTYINRMAHSDHDCMQQRAVPSPGAGLACSHCS